MEYPRVGSRRGSEEDGTAEATGIDGTQISQQGGSWFRLFRGKPTIKILFYTDYEGINLDPDVDASENEFGVAILRDLLLADDSDLAEFQITLLNRHLPTQASTKLTPALLAGFDEVWFFGLRRANRASELENELTDPEVAALQNWMATGGVFVTGDHSNPRPVDADPSLDTLLSLGRAIAHRVPRAGALRRWDGGPPIDGPAAYNTQVPTPQVPVGQIEDLAAQEDQWPQKLMLKTFPAPTTGPFDPPVFGRRVHRLFCGRTTPINVFPDHMHEGHLLIPQAFPAAVWPSGPNGQPLPEVIAQGTDKRSAAIYDIVIAYDGDAASVGRIVADSTWHHYFNVNLKGFPAGGPVINQLAQYYVNLAVWLAPSAKRSQIAFWQIWKLLHVPTVQMAYGNSRFSLGRAAASVLRRRAGPCVIQDVFEPTLGPWAPQELFRPSEELILGGVLHSCFEAFERADAGEAREPGDEDFGAVVARGIKVAYDDAVTELDRSTAEARHARERVDERTRASGDATTT